MHPFRKTPAALVAVVLAGVSLTACSPDTESEPAEESTPTSRPASQPSGPAGAVVSSLKSFYTQKLDWGDCRSYATTKIAEQAMALPGLQCAKLTVPLDYSKPDGEKIKIGVLRKAASGQDRVGSLVINPGGPGQSGMEAAAGMGTYPTIDKLNKQMDIVGFDPRGVGASEPAIDCLTDKEMDDDRGEDSEEDTSAKGIAAFERKEREFAAKCADNTDHGKQMLANLGTRDVVKDMDILRSVLGDKKLTYLGYSYGTRIGYSYAEAFPKNVRAMILDGALDPEKDAVEGVVDQGEGFGKAFKEFTAWCAKQNECALGEDPKKATQAYRKLVTPLIKTKVDTSDGRPLSYEDATTGTMQALYDESQWSQLNSGLTELKQQRGDGLLALADMYYQRGPDGKYASTTEAFVAIHCVDDPPVTDKAKIRAANEKYAEVAPFLDSGTKPAAARDACAFWPVKHTSEPHLPKVQGVPAPLVISTTNDPATPYQAGVQLAKAMKGELLTFEGTQHTVFGQGVKCVDDAGSAYLLNGKLADNPKRCRK